MFPYFSRLRCNYLENPLGIEDARPHLFWQLQTDRPGARQVAYRLQAATAPEKLDAPDLWDSARVDSDQTTHVAYQGAAPQSRQRVWWRVTVWDETGAATTSDVAFWEMGLLSRDEWRAAWIGADLCGGPHTSDDGFHLDRLTFRPRRIRRGWLRDTASRCAGRVRDNCLRFIRSNN